MVWCEMGRLGGARNAPRAHVQKALSAQTNTMYASVALSFISQSGLRDDATELDDAADEPIDPMEKDSTTNSCRGVCLACVI